MSWSLTMQIVELYIYFYQQILPSIRTSTVFSEQIATNMNFGLLLKLAFSPRLKLGCKILSVWEHNFLWQCLKIEIKLSEYIV